MRSTCAGLLALTGCLDPTQIEIEVLVHVPCSRFGGVAISVGEPGASLESATAATEAATCDEATGRVGSLVTVPSGDDDGSVAIRVVAGVDRPAAECQPPDYGPGCIVARRALHYLPHTRLYLPITLRLDCEDVPCNADTTCVGGGCRDASIDPDACTSAGACTDALVFGSPATAAPAMVQVLDYFVDATEVTNAQYQAFLDAGIAPSPDDGPGCGATNQYAPAVWPLADRDGYPVTGVDWCDARAYCRWAGKHLCDGIHGSAADPYQEADKDQWAVACSENGARAYPYGSTFDAEACNVQTDGTHPVASLSTCEGGFAGLFDLSGNVSEWGRAYESDRAWIFGGSYRGTCERVNPAAFTDCHPECVAINRFVGGDDIGIRCCAY